MIPLAENACCAWPTKSTGHANERSRRSVGQDYEPVHAPPTHLRGTTEGTWPDVEQDGFGHSKSTPPNPTTNAASTPTATPAATASNTGPRRTRTPLSARSTNRNIERQVRYWNNTPET